MRFRSVFAIDSGKLLPLCVCAQLWNSTLWTPKVWTMSLRALIWQARICPRPFRGRKRKGVPWFQFGSSLTQALLKLQPQLICPYKYIGAQYGSYSSNYHNTLQLLLYSAAPGASLCDWVWPGRRRHTPLLWISCSFVHRGELRTKRISAAATPKWQKRTLIWAEVNDFARSKAAENVPVSLERCAKIKPW